MPVTSMKTLYFAYDGNTIEVNPHQAEILIYDQEAEEYVKYDNNQIVDLYKKGNRKAWQYKITHKDMTDTQFEALRLEFEAMNGFVITFDPHYDSGTAGYQCWFEFYLDDCNNYPVIEMDLNITCIDYTDQEA